ncbi:MAG: hypothetical protein RR996_04395 [Alistipes sp.]
MLGRGYIALPHLRGRVAELRNRLARARYFRGHGVHSPFVYDIVRHVFMSHKLLGSDTSLRDVLLAAGVGGLRALELQNLMTHCGYHTFAVCGGSFDELAGALAVEGGVASGANVELYVLLSGLSEDETWHMVHQAAGCGATVAVVTPYADPKRERMCRAMIFEHSSTTVDNRGYLLIFNNKCLPKQHFRI